MPPDDIGGTVAISLANWRAFAASSVPLDIQEYPLFTDAHLVGEGTEGLGPYELVNTVAGGDFTPGVPSAVLRIRAALPADALPDMRETDATRYHGGTLEDEVAALVALELGIRLKAGPLSPWFHPGPDGYGLGRPVAWSRLARGTPTLERGRPPRIPDLVAERDLGACTRIKRLPSIQGRASAHLAKSARLYQEAVWISDVDPALSWLLLVSAVETAANYWRAGEEPPVERLRASKPELEPVLREGGGDAFVERVAALIAPYMGATRKFIDFLLAFRPPSPQPRPPDAFAIDWSATSLAKALRTIYGQRSKALHEGTPFPYPMGDPPSRLDGGAHSEKPPWLATAYLGGVWRAEDLPMVLNVFHHIARGALLNWWDHLAPAQDPTPLPRIT
jgi:hypothetical protein